MPQTLFNYFALKGGLNLVTPPLSLPDGMCRDALNFEVDIDGGYRRIDGYERYSGKPAPSSANYGIIYCTFSDEVELNDTVVGATSAATGVVIAIDEFYMAITKLTGSFDEGETVNVGGSPVAVITEISSTGGAPSALLNATYLNLAADVYRADIAAVPGAGRILGVHRYYQNGKVYAFRNNVGNTEAKMYQDSGAGWVLVDLGYEIRFSNANADVEEGDTLTQGGVTATVNRVVVQTGSLASGVNTGRLITSLPAGGNFAAGAATSTGGGALTLSGVQTAITLAPNGRYECINYNFGGLAGSIKMYGASGTHRAFEFDGTVFVPIETGMAVDTPSHIISNNNHLFLSYDGSMQHSAPGNPYAYTIILGAGELAMGDTITGFLSQVGTQATASLVVFTKNKTAILYGTSSDNWQLVTYSFEAGGFEYTMQNIGAGYVLDAFGVKQIISSDAFGNFNDAQITKNVRPFVQSRVTNAVGSCISRARNQYRIMFSDQFAIYITFDNQKVVGIMPVLYAHSMTCMTSFESETSDEFIFSGDTDGFVYRMNRGTSFDGEDIEGYLYLTFNHIKSPRIRKRYRKAVYEVTGNGYAQFVTTYELGYGSDEIEQGTDLTKEIFLNAANWDEFTWDQFTWDGRSLLPQEQDITGTAENISLIVKSMGDYFEPFTINSAILHYTPRRNLR